ncbi:MAG: hypothetical protein OCD02_21050 [Spirochaetaceae bacterium]
MTQEKDKYLKIFKIELTNLIDDVSALINYEKELHESRAHSNFVYLENLVVLKDEIMGINGILGHIDDMANELDDTNYIDDLLVSIESFIQKRGYPMAVFDLIKGKVKRIESIRDIYI